MDEPTRADAPEEPAEPSPGLFANPHVRLFAVAVSAFLAGLIVGATAGTARSMPKQAPESLRESSLRLITAGLAEHRATRIDAAEALYREALRLDPSSSLAAYDLGCVALDRRKLDEAERWFIEAAKLDPANQAALSNLAWIRGQRRAPASPTPTP